MGESIEILQQSPENIHYLVVCPPFILLSFSSCCMQPFTRKILSFQRIVANYNKMMHLDVYGLFILHLVQNSLARTAPFVCLHNRLPFYRHKCPL